MGLLSGSNLQDSIKKIQAELSVNWLYIKIRHHSSTINIITIPTIKIRLLEISRRHSTNDCSPLITPKTQHLQIGPEEVFLLTMLHDFFPKVEDDGIPLNGLIDNGLLRISRLKNRKRI